MIWGVQKVRREVFYDGYYLYRRLIYHTSVGVRSYESSLCDKIQRDDTFISAFSYMRISPGLMKHICVLGKLTKP